MMTASTGTSVCRSKNHGKETSKLENLRSNSNATPYFFTSSTKHSEPECEVHPTGEMWEEPSDPEPGCSKPNKNIMNQQSFINRIQKELPRDPQDLLIQEQCETVALWKDLTSNLPSKNTNEDVPQRKWEMHAKSAPTVERKYNGSKDVGIGEEESISSSILYLREAEYECHSTTGLEDAEDVFSESLFETTLSIDCDSSFCLDLEGTNSEIQMAVNEIRKEAAKMDTMMLLDQLKTLQTEFDSVTKKCSVTCLENEDLRAQVQKSKDRIAHMELERDLYQADAKRLREDLNTLVTKMFDISAYESSELATNTNPSETPKSSDSDRVIQSFKDKPPNKILFPGITGVRPALNSVTMMAAPPENMRIIGLVSQPRNTIRRSLRSSDPVLIGRHPCSKVADFSQANDIYIVPSSPENLRNQNVFRIRNDQRAVRPRTKSVSIKRSKDTRLPSDRRKRDIKGVILSRHQSLSVIDTKSTNFTTEMKLEEEEKEKRRCGILFRRRSKRQSFSQEDVSLMKHQVQQLHEMMKSSLGASEKLRKRIATISRYYEGVISKLQVKVSEVKSEKSRAEVYLTNKISQLDLEQRLAQSKFDYELQQKDKEITKLKAARDQGEV